MSEDNPEQIQGPPAVERVITGEDAKFYRFRCVVAHLASSVYDLEKAEIAISNPVKVLDVSGFRIGYATVYADGAHRVLADVVIDYSTEERLIAETDSLPLWLKPFGTMRFAPMEFQDLQARLRPLDWKVEGLQFTLKSPADPHLVTRVGTVLL